MGPRDPRWPRLTPDATTDIAIVGAGAAGLATAIFTRRLNPSLSVLLLETARRPGAKILVSGGSRCNVTNAAVSERDFHGGSRSFIRHVLRRFTVAETTAFFADVGVPLHEEAHGKLFPDSNRSRDVLDALLRALADSGATLRASTRIVAVVRTDSGWRLSADGFDVHTRAVVLAAGGQSLPRSGSDGGGFDIARALGHTIVPTTPALVPLVLAESLEALHAPLKGVAHPAALALWIGGALAERFTGDLLWTHFGISGPVVLNASRHWLRTVLDRRAATMTVSFCPNERFETLDASWTSLATSRPLASVQTSLAALVPASVAAVLLARLGIDGATPLARFTRGDRRRLTRALLEWPLDIVDSRGYTYAEATAGGVDLNEVHASTLESRLRAGLFFVGEILDVDGRLGGFNFQWAWSSARTAADALARGGVQEKGEGEESTGE